MVGLQAMVLGRLGRKPSPHPRACALSCPSPFAGRGSTGLRPYIMPIVVGRVVLLPILLQRGLHFAPPSALRGTSGGATMAHNSPGRFWFPPHPPARVLLMYTRATSLPKLYIRNTMPGDMGIPLLEHLALSGRGYALFTQVRGRGILGSSPPEIHTKIVHKGMRLVPHAC